MDWPGGRSDCVVVPDSRDECANNSRTACAELLILHLLRGSVVLGRDVMGR